MSDKPPEKLILRCFRAPGDTVAATACARDVRLSFPGTQVALWGRGSEELLTADPDQAALTADMPGVEVIDLDYRAGIAAVQLGAKVTFLEDFHRDLRRKKGWIVPLTDPRPHLVLTETEEQQRPFPFPYWVLVAGGKSDLPTKIWSSPRFQEVVSRTKGQVNWVQVGATKGITVEHRHFKLDGVVDLVGKTNLRQLMQLIRHADGVLTGVSMAMLMAAAFWRPCVVVAGGRESYHWQAFHLDNEAWGRLANKIETPHRFLHTAGKLPCSKPEGCLAAQVVRPHHDSDFPPGFLCQRPVEEGGVPLPECMKSITVDQVVAAVTSY